MEIKTMSKERAKLWDDFRHNIVFAFHNWSEYRYPVGPKDQSGDKFDKWCKAQIPEFLEQVKKELMDETY